MYPSHLVSLLRHTFPAVKKQHQWGRPWYWNSRLWWRGSSGGYSRRSCRPRSQAGTSPPWGPCRSVQAQAQSDSRSLPCCEERPMVHTPTYPCPMCISYQYAALTPAFRPHEPEGELYRKKVDFRRDLRLMKTEPSPHWEINYRKIIGIYRSLSDKFR